MKKKVAAKKKLPTAKEVTLTSTVDVANEHATDIPNLARVTLSPAFIKRIRKLSEVVKQNDVAYVATYDYSINFFNREDTEDDNYSTTEWDGSAECVMLVVTSTGFYWKGLIKHTDWLWETEGCSLKFLNEILAIAALPVGDMPTLMNDEDEDIRALARKRMAEGK